MGFQLVKVLGNPHIAIISGGIVPQGAYDNGTDYAVGDMVEYNGTSYVMFVNAGAGTLPTDDTKWMIVAERGTDGTNGADGSDGADGADGLSITWKGTYSGATGYVVNDAVVYNGSSYICILNSTGNLPTDTTYWNLLASKGDTGATGVTGSAGADGVMQSVIAGNNIDVDATDPANPIVSVETLTLADISDVTASITEVNYIDGVTSAIQTQLDGKVDENATITGATKTKITYDTKGLVTSGADATTADIADSSNKRYVTDAQLTVIGNTSNTNSGDNATNSQYSGLATSKANVALDNLVSVAINTSLISDTDSTDDLGSSAKYWANTYTDKLYLNATATLDGATGGLVNLTGNLDISAHLAIGGNASIDTDSVVQIAENISLAGGSEYNGLIVNNAITTAGTGSAYGLNFQVNQNATTGTVAFMAGLKGALNIRQAAAVTSAYGGWNVIELKSTATGAVVATAKVGESWGIAGGGTFTDLIGYNIKFTKSGSGAITNAYGLRVEAVTAGGTLNYAIYTNAGLNHFGGALEIVGNINPTTDSARDLGTSSLYWANTYTDKIYLNSTAALDGATAGKLNVTGGLLHADNISTYWGTGVDASIYYDGTNLVVNPKLVGTGYLNVLGAVYSSGKFYSTVVGDAGGIFINTNNGQYNSSGFFMYNSASSMGNYGGVHMAASIMDASATEGTFLIDRVNYQGNYVSSLFEINMNTGITTIKSSGGFKIEQGVGFYNTAPQSKPTVTGLKGANAALGSLLSALSTLGLITDSSGT